MKKRIAIAITLVAAVGALAAAPLVMAGPHGGFGGDMGFHGLGFFRHLGHLESELDLSEPQVDQLKAILAEVREQNAPYREQLHGGYKGVVEALVANPNDVAGAQALIDQQTAAERAVKANFLNAASKALAVLNAEQRAKLSTMIEEHAAERRGRRGR